MKSFNLKPHEIGYLKLLYSTFAGIDYAVANADVKAKNRKDSRNFKTIREVAIEAQRGLASEYIRAALIMEGLIPNDPTLFCTFDPSDDNKDGEVNVYTQDDLISIRAKNLKAKNSVK